MPLKTNRTLFYLTDEWHRSLIDLSDDVWFDEYDEFKGVRVLIPKSVDKTSMPLGGIDACINKIVAPTPQ